MLNSKLCKLIVSLRLCPFPHECMVYSGFRVRSFGVISAWCDLDQKNCLDHGASKEPLWIHSGHGFTGFFDAPWSRQILDHWSWSRSPQRNAPLCILVYVIAWMWLHSASDLYHEGYLENLSTKNARAFWRVLDCWQPVGLLKISRGYEARRFTPKENVTRHGCVTPSSLLGHRYTALMAEVHVKAVLTSL